jgi:hypothetical protein
VVVGPAGAADAQAAAGPVEVVQEQVREVSVGQGVDSDENSTSNLAGL